MLLVLLVVGRDVAAQADIRCTAPDGTVSLTENQCPPQDKAERLPPPPAALHPDLAALCTPGAREDQYRDAACGMMVSCRDADRTNCVIYCSTKFQPQFPTLQLGPTSPACLKLTGRKRGANWVQAASRARIGGEYELEAFTFLCVDPHGTPFPKHEQIVCRRGTSDCPEAGSLEAKVASICSETYGTQLSPTAPWKAPPPEYQRSGLLNWGLPAGLIAAVALGAALLWRRRKSS